MRIFKENKHPYKFESLQKLKINDNKDKKPILSSKKDEKLDILKYEHAIKLDKRKFCEI